MVSPKHQKERKQKAMVQIRAVQNLLRQWDPMDLAPGALAPADEYDDNATRIVSMVAKGCSLEALQEYLRDLRYGMECVRDKSEDDGRIALAILDELARLRPTS